ncbi:MAG: hypothetical protein LBG25_06555, partial [Spirochaetaceae bacterium]|nr:hypothetical protein [Spirochaetaceae bacterium]
MFATERRVLSLLNKHLGVFNVVIETSIPVIPVIDGVFLPWYTPCMRLICLDLEGVLVPEIW